MARLFFHFYDLNDVLKKYNSVFSKNEKKGEKNIVPLKLNNNAIRTALNYRKNVIDSLTKVYKNSKYNQWHTRGKPSTFQANYKFIFKIPSIYWYVDLS